jgi:hypothetical protein
MKTAAPSSAPSPAAAPARQARRAPRKTSVQAAAAPPVKPVARAAAQPATRPAPRKKAVVAAKAAPTAEPVSTTPAAPAAAEKPAKPPKVRLVRDSFTMPETDFALVAVLKARALGQGRAAKKSELLRAGLQMLSQQDPAVLLAALERLQPIKTGRPKRGD